MWPRDPAMLSWWALCEGAATRVVPVLGGALDPEPRLFCYNCLWWQRGNFFIGRSAHSLCLWRADGSEMRGAAAVGAASTLRVERKLPIIPDFASSWLDDVANGHLGLRYLGGWRNQEVIQSDDFMTCGCCCCVNLRTAMNTLRSNIKYVNCVILFFRTVTVSDQEITEGNPFFFGFSFCLSGVFFFCKRLNSVPFGD